MTEQTKINRTQIKDLTMSQQEISSAEMAQINGGGAVQTGLGGGITGAQGSVSGTTPTLTTKKEIIANRPIHSEQEAR